MKQTEAIKEWIIHHQAIAAAAVVCVCLAGYLLSLKLRAPEEAWLYVGFVNEYQNVSAGSPLYEEFCALPACEGKRVVFYASSSPSFSNA